MGQYYYLVNLDKKEYVSPWDIEGVGKLREWATKKHVAAIPLLLGYSTSWGGGDPDWDDEEIKEVAGRWAGDRVAMIGDYYERKEDTRKLDLPEWDEIEKDFVNISPIVLRAMKKLLTEVWVWPPK